ncbi:hypothetical protein SBBP2_140033 [Burkholderiales bacterium]|nr:hypothetical protein SBBP2_140033 [Burkholderiales bacterium]
MSEQGNSLLNAAGQVACLTAAGVGCCALANNHVLDWGYRGLAETIAVLQRAGI